MRATRCWNATVSGPSSWTLAISSRAFSPRMTSVVPVSSDWRPGVAAADGTSTSTSEASAPFPSSTIVRVMSPRSGGADGPAQVDGLGELDPVGHAQDRALVPGGAGQLGEAVGLGERGGVGEQALRGGRVAGDERPERFEGHAGLGGRRVQLDAEDPVLLERGERGGVGRELEACRSASSPRSRTGGRPRGRPRAGRRRSCTGGWSRSGASAKRSSAARRSAADQSGSRAASASTNAGSRWKERSVGARRTGRGRDGVAGALTPATPPSPASPGG